MLTSLDSHFQVNHLSQFHLAMMLWSNLSATPNSRLVLQSSDLHRGCPSSTTFTSVSEINTDLGPMNLYNRTKLAQVLTVRAIVRRMEENQPGFQSPKATGPWVLAVHPGGVNTDQQEQAVDAYGTIGKVGVKAIRPFMKNPVDEGCRPALFAATSDDIVKEMIQGQYVSSSPGRFALRMSNERGPSDCTRSQDYRSVQAGKGRRAGREFMATERADIAGQIGRLALQEPSHDIEGEGRMDHREGCRTGSDDTNESRVRHIGLLSSSYSGDISGPVGISQGVLRKKPSDADAGCP